jgi:tetratricopeptide (TPR) repeat protein
MMKTAAGAAAAVLAAVMVFVVSGQTAAAAGPDKVREASGIAYSGTILELDGGKLVIRDDEGKSRSIPLGQVRDVSCGQFPDLNSAESEFAAGSGGNASRLRNAEGFYDRLIKESSTPQWTECLVKVRLFKIYSLTERPVKAVEMYLALAAADPAVVKDLRLPLPTPDAMVNAQMLHRVQVALKTAGDKPHVAELKRFQAAMAELKGTASDPMPKMPLAEAEKNAEDKPVAAPTYSDTRAKAVAEATKAEAAGTLAEREDRFLNARQYYQRAIDDAVKAMRATKEKSDHSRIQYDILQMRMALSDMILLKWMRPDLDLLEASDRRAGDRSHAAELAKAAFDLNWYRGILGDITGVVNDMDFVSPAERTKDFIERSQELRRLERQAEFSRGLANFYYGWLLSPDFKPNRANGEMSKRDLLNDAKSIMEKLAKELPSDAAAKWHAQVFIAICQRELDRHELALEALAAAEQCKGLPEDQQAALKIRIGLERARTLLAKGDEAAARKAIEDTRKAGGDRVKKSVYGLALDLAEAESYAAEGERTAKDDLKQKGAAMFKALAARPDPWPTLVRGVTGGKIPPDEVKPLASLKSPWGDAGAGLATLVGDVTAGGDGGGRLFGVGASLKKGAKVVYILDRSGSMTDAMDYLKFEVNRCLYGIPDGAQFHVIFYSSGPPVEMPAKKLVEATKDTRAAAIKFVGDVKPEGETDPSKAIELAFACKPDVIYLMTDGEFKKEVAAQVKQLNAGGKVTVHTISFLYASGADVLKQIANENGGEFKIYTEQDLANLMN